VVALVGAPLSDAGIAKRLKISVETVEKHRFNILRKLELSSTAELMRYAREHGFTLSTSMGDDGALLP
jgi:two-component system NarL family response regulator